MEENKAISLEDIMVCDPISKRGREALKRIINQVPEAKMNCSDFFKKIYVRPFFTEKITRREPKTDKSQQNTYENIRDFSFSLAGVTVDLFRRDKQEFEDKFFSKNTNVVLFLRAFSGAGKSIYLNELKWMRKEKNKIQVEDEGLLFENGRLNEANELSFDLEQSISTVTRGKVSFPSSDYTIPMDGSGAITAPWCFYCTLLDSTFCLINKIINKNDKSEFERIRENFNKIYGVDYSDETGSIFALMEYKENGVTENRKISSQLLSGLLDESFKDTSKSKPTVRICIRNLLRIMTRVISCMSDLSNPKQVLISLDNIEHFVRMKRRIFDEDIGVIVDSVRNFMNEEEEYYSRRGLVFAEFFKVIFVVRDTTSKMLTTDVHEDYYQNHLNSVNISNWYKVEDIYSKKLEYFKDFHITTYPSTDFFQLIIKNDSKSSTGIMEQVSSMYNQNKRRITRILARIAGIFDQHKEHPDLNQGVLTYEQFKGIWEKSHAAYTKFLCRQAILRLIFNEISKTGYFNRISGYPSYLGEAKATYARRILTFLANNRRGGTDDSNDDYVGFYQLIRNVFASPQIPDENIPSEVFREIAKILIALDEFRFSAEPQIPTESSIETGNCWCQLVILKMNDTQLTHSSTVNILAAQMQTDYKAKSQNGNKFGVKITDAGYFFANILCYFEFFACQCAEHSTPLILMSNPENIRTIIRKVYDYSQNYINETLLFEKSFFHDRFKVGHKIDYYLRHTSHEGNTYYLPLAFRIISRHRDYLQAYKQFIDDDTIQDNLKVFSSKERADLSSFISTYIKKYKLLYEQIDGSNYIFKNTWIAHYFSDHFNLPELR